MSLSEAMKALEGYDLALAITGLAVLAMVVQPRLLSDKPASAPMVLLGLGFAAFALPLGLEAPIRWSRATLRNGSPNSE